MRALSALLVVLLAVAHVSEAVDKSKFRTCENTPFCKRLRKSDSFPKQEYSLEDVSTDGAQGLLTGALKNGRHPLQEPLDARVQVLRNGAVRVSVRERRPKHVRWEVKDVLQAEAVKPLEGGVAWQPLPDNKGFVGMFGSGQEVTVSTSPFTVVVSVNGQAAVGFNTEGLLTFEQYREKNPKPEVPAPAEGEAAAEPVEVDPKSLQFPYDSEGMWEETHGGHTDSRPRGPAAVGVDISFFGAEHVYGIPEHASSFALKTTRGDGAGYAEPYRLYNLDVFEFELDVPMALYGAVPYLLSHDADKTAGALWLNSAETYVDIADGKDQAGNPRKESHWMSESGIIDVFLFPGPQPDDVYAQYAMLTGFPALPQRFTTAYHQCRWNYKSQEDVAEVDAGFDKHDIPYDVLWLDIEHTDGKKYFTWDKGLFPDPKQMQENIAAKGRKMVTIVDPHIKRDSGYKVHKEALDRDLYIRKPGGSGEFEGWCWPGSVSYPDFLLPEVRNWWADQFQFSSYEASTPTLFTWNDMNEPSVFNGPEVSMPKDCMHDYGTVEHRDVHNLYGFYVQMATEAGQRRRESNVRPFVLTRAFYAGTQRYGPVWTGDNKAEWSHLESAQPMLLSLNVAGIVFSGADVGGFFGNPDAELLVRWYQAGAFQPFFRGHAHIDTKRREPWVFGEPTTTLIRDAIRMRYAYLPYMYSVFHESSVTGKPIMRPLWSEFPADRETFAMEDQFLVGHALLIKPVTKAGEESVRVYLPGTQPWYDTQNVQKHAGEQTLTVLTPLRKIPVFQRGGTIIPRRERARRSSAAMEKDPFTLVVALDNEGAASGSLYLDDGRTFDYQQGGYDHRTFRFSGDVLTAAPTDVTQAFLPPFLKKAPAAASQALAPVTGPAAGLYKTDCTVERIVLWGARKPYTTAVLKIAGQPDRVLKVLQEGEQIIVRKPDAPISGDWSIHFA